jgi:hypothetical protein
MTRRIDAPDLDVVCAAIEAFIMPPAQAAALSSTFSMTWDPS